MLNIQEIRASAFRGLAKNFSIRLNGKSLVLYGDNGTGKSSIVEALEYALTGKVQSLESRGQRVTFARHGTHVTMDRTETTVGVVVGDGKLEHTISIPDKRMPKNSEVAAFLNGCPHGTFILRRNKLLAFIESVDRDRYAALRPFLGIEHYDGFEKSLKEAKELQEKAKLEAEARYEVAKAEFLRGVHLDELAEIEAGQVLNALSQSLGTIGYPAVKSYEEVKTALCAVNEKLKNYGDTSAQSRVAECRSRLNDYVLSLPNADMLHDVSIKAGRVEQLEAETTGKFYEEVLKQGRQWIQESDIEICPLCEQTIADRKALLQRIQERLEENSELVSARSELKKSVAALKARLDASFENYDRALAHWKAAGFEDKLWTFTKVGECLRSISSALGENARISDRVAFEKALEIFKNHDVKSAADNAGFTIKAKEDALPKSEDVQRLIDLHARCVLFIDRFPVLQKQKNNAVALTKDALMISRIYEFAVEARKSACREVFEEISKSIGKIYEKFHPHEGLGNFELEVKDVGAGSAILKGCFPHREAEDPRGLYSDAHLDTLGLAVFLALRKREERLNPMFRIIVLDDILTSVDAPHRKRVTEYLLSEFSQDHQMILTTHSRLWFEWIVQLQNSQGLRERFINKRILDWSLENGPEIVDMEGDYEFVRNQMHSMAHENVAPVAGRLLESMLQELRYSLRLAVEAKRDDRYTIGDLWPKFMSSCSKRLKGLWGEIEPLCTSLNDTVVIRNWETHASEWAKELSRNEAMQFVEGVLTLYPKIFCQKCSTFVEACEIPQGAASCRKGCLLYPAKGAGQN